ncbi:MAG: universal stress protein [Crocinitomicaceae bacterium]|jgi:nucleotide-binding universal stress UspA family protein|nr:universal stress protein [Crocinitomicaceae bacterium]MCF8434908.1 universal stress protein [Crocinitomicaceae bacterium]MDP4683396.1 universal stress protein [Crocinitomicaceae bacterium]MDP4866977.1 universal stress protein [Crocinitomicaceae bacterium]MDP5011959.1 universal stress protein [Crocinitomicaceae bacterium]
MKTKTFIVPHDFTPVADIALEHAIATAKPLDATVFILHVVPKEKNIVEAEEKLNEIIKAHISSGVQLIPYVRLGSIFEEIGDFAAEHHAELIFMGTHGATGWQHVTGSHALKVVTNSSVPFIIVQDKGIKATGYDDIVVPMDLNKETKQKLAIVADLATYLKSRVHVITPKETDEFLQHKVQANIQFAEKFFSERGIEMTATVVSGSGFDKEVVKHAVNIDADLIAIMNLHRGGILTSLGANYEQYIITNDAKIPALIVNPIDLSGNYGQSILFS